MIFRLRRLVVVTVFATISSGVCCRGAFVFSNVWDTASAGTPLSAAFVVKNSKRSTKLSSESNESSNEVASTADTIAPPTDTTVKEEKIKSKTWNPLRLGVLRLGLTEPAWTSPWNYQKKQGTFNCAYCGQKLFDSNSKYDSGSGWPSFWRSASNGAVDLTQEWDGRVECTCSNCNSHLGHVFPDGPRPEAIAEKNLLDTIPESDPKGRDKNSRLPRFCINGAALTFDESEK